MTNYTDSPLRESSKRVIRKTASPDVFLTLNIDRYDPAQVKAWGYYYFQTRGHTSQNPKHDYSLAGGIAELYSFFEAGIQDAIGHTVLYTLPEIARKEGFSYRYIHAEVQHRRLSAFNVGGIWLVKHHDYALWKAKRTGKRTHKGRSAR